MAQRYLLIVDHAPSDNTKKLRDAVADGAQSPDIQSVEVVCRNPFEAEPEDILAAQAIILGTTENLD